MKKILVIAAILASGPALSFMSLKSCNVISTTSGTKWMGTYCDMQGNCLKMLFDSYCPPML